MSSIETSATHPAGSLAPVSGKDRIFNLDVLRGWAVLGILAVNAMAFAWPLEVEMAGAKPFADSAANQWGHWATDVFFADKFRTLFTMLFGVSIFLVGGDRSDEGRGKLLRSRLFWLLIFGLIHGLAFWYGDILLHYAYCGFLMLLMRSMKPAPLIWIGGLITLLWGLLAVLGPIVFASLPAEFMAKAQANQPQVSTEDIMATVAVYKEGTGAWIENAKAWAQLQFFSLFLIPISIPLMMLGLGLFKSGFLGGRSPVVIYLLLILLTGANLAVFGWATLPGMDADSLPIKGLDDAAGGLAPLITLGYASLLILLTRFGGRVITGVLAPVGQMAFTNYLTQTLIMVTLFYMPWGTQWFGTMGPGQLWSIVGAVWIAQLIWSPLWLSVFNLGPLEWVWRCLTYGRMVPLRKRG
ncbi:DUF418 domain-containing protein [Rhizobium sp. CRIBSB]|nr:DUF418 domain-containing protein [Rhizobium sp. CRIBSB]